MSTGRLLLHSWLQDRHACPGLGSLAYAVWGLRFLYLADFRRSEGMGGARLGAEFNYPSQEDLTRVAMNVQRSTFNVFNVQLCPYYIIT